MFGFSDWFTFGKHGQVQKTTCGGFLSLLSLVVIIGFIAVRIPLLGEGAFDLFPKQESKYSLFGNLLPELAGLVVAGRLVLSCLIHPVALMNFRIHMISQLFLAKSKENLDALPRDARFCGLGGCSGCRL